MEFNGDVDVDNLGLHQACTDPILPPHPHNLEYQRIFQGNVIILLVIVYLMVGLKKTVKREGLFPSAPELYYAIQCNNGTGIGRGDLYMTLYDPKCNAKGQSDSFSNLVTHRPSHVNSCDWIIKLKPGWNLVCVQAYTKHKIWFSELQRNAVYSKYPLNILPLKCCGFL
mmetsp:Transcript_6482/g.7491  ORF Transcript_6482/g.7491 Transcript_6482/m.7491 type:complete len:169 (-) Transcript_6482:69-575(-)